ncbi:Hypothetical predicted protein, partial [Paramuricea clavata]
MYFEEESSSNEGDAMEAVVERWSYFTYKAKHGEKTAVTKSVSPLTSEVVGEIVDKATQSVVKSKLYGDAMTKLFGEADLKASKDLVRHLATLYDQYCEKLNRDKLLKNFYKLMPE